MLANSLFLCVLVACASTVAAKESKSVFSNVLEFFNPLQPVETKGEDKDKNKRLRGELRPRVAPVILDVEDTAGKKKAGLIKPAVIVNTEEEQVKVKPIKKPAVIVDTEEESKPATKANKVAEKVEEDPVVLKAVKKTVAKEAEEEGPVVKTTAKVAAKGAEEVEETPVAKKVVGKFTPKMVMAQVSAAEALKNAPTASSSPSPKKGPRIVSEAELDRAANKAEAAANNKQQPAIITIAPKAAKGGPKIVSTEELDKAAAIAEASANKPKARSQIFIK